MKTGIRSPLTGLMASAPRATPVLSRSVERRSISVRRRACSTYASTSARWLGCVSVATSGCSGREDHERRPEQRVRAGREDAQGVAAGLVVVGGGLEVDLGAFGSADPVGLHDLDRLRPVESGEVQQLIRVGRRAQVPLLQVALLDQRAAAPAASLRALDLLAGQGPVVRAPIDRRLGAIGQALLHELEEQPLVPAVVLGVRGHDLGIPREGRAHRPELAAHVLDVRHRPRERVAAVLDGGVLRGQAEGIEADREEHVVAVHPPIAGERVRRRDDVPVADVQVARRIRVHREQVVLGLAAVAQVRVVQAELRPLRLPARLDGAGVVAFDPGSVVGGVGFGFGHGVLGYHAPPAGRARGGRSAVSVMVELRGLEPRTPCMPCRCSSS